ncbi:MAG: type II toxin-antitoxin system MqsA family antitoxin [Magnetococcales bacterium]|nr:type II toxin-antitoxin system MqsA family antitoxin [Magnetococcales bacterium]
MHCAICRHGETLAGETTVTLERARTIVVIREVPADVCEQCGEYYLDEKATARVFALAEEAVQRHAEVEILRYAA